MAITHVVVRGLNIDKNEFEVITEWDVEPGDRDPERTGHEIAAMWLNEHYPNWWCYRYANLKDGVTTETPGTLPDSHYGDGTKVDGVVNMHLIADDGFRGQFQWNDRAWDERRLGGHVPATVSCTDPVKEAEYARRAAEQRAEDARKAAEVQAKVDALSPMRFTDGGAELWQSWVDANQDAYGGAVVTYAERWARLMQDEMLFTAPIYAQIRLAEIADRTSREADTEGITGFMYGCAVGMLAKAWVFGEELRRWHNKEWGAPDAEGTVNPALLTIGTK